MIIPLGTNWNQLEPLVPTGSDQIPTNSKQFRSESSRNHLESGRNGLEPTGSDWYLQGTEKYWTD